jgi:hypothetical protein
MLLLAVLAALLLVAPAAAVVTEQSNITYVGDGNNTDTNFYGTLPAQLGANPLYGVIATFPEIPGTATGITITFSEPSNFYINTNITVYVLNDATDVSTVTFNTLPLTTYIGSTTPIAESVSTYDVEVSGTLTNGVYILFYSGLTTYLYNVDNISVTSVTTTSTTSSITTTSTTAAATTTTTRPSDPDHTVLLAVSYTLIFVAAIVAFSVYIYLNASPDKARGVYTKLT